MVSRGRTTGFFPHATATFPKREMRMLMRVDEPVKIRFRFSGQAASLSLASLASASGGMDTLPPRIGATALEYSPGGDS